MSRPLGVGFLGAGPVTQAIHLPALAELGDLLRVQAVMDTDATLAEAVAGRVGARWTSDADDLVGDPEVDVVAVCSPDRFHAAGVIAACEAGKRAVLCEKPFAVSAEEARSIATVAERTGVPIVIGAMHVYDPGWRGLVESLGPRGVEAVAAHTVRSSIVLPPNPRFEDFATEVADRQPFEAPDYADPDTRAAIATGGVLGLAIHDLPLIRRFLRDSADVRVESARVQPPFGYLIVIRSGDQTVELHARMTANWSPRWMLEATGPRSQASVLFPPSYVKAGSSVAELAEPGRSVVLGPYPDNGYVGEWREIAAVAAGQRPVVGLEDCIADLTFALAIAEQAAASSRTQDDEVAAA